jgi:beta-lactamase class A
MQEILFKKIIIAILALTIGVLVGISLEKVFWRRSVQCLSKLHLIKPNLDCDSFDDKAETLSTLQNKLEVFIDGIKKTGKVKRVGVFVRDLRTSHFAGVNDNDAYYMASLLKTPLLIGGFKLAEVEPKILDQEIVYNGKPNLYDEQVIQVEDKLKVGSSYTIKELMERSVENSDNTAAQILFDYYPAEFMDRILQALGIQIKKPTGEVENLITARTYANVFRLLYNSSYLTKEYSNEALEILTKTSFNLGATAKLPKDVVVAHKFAERTSVDARTGETIKQFHECGLVYIKKSKEPYAFCIMTEGDKYENLEGAIADISLLIYNDMTKEAGD